MSVFFFFRTPFITLNSADVCPPARYWSLDPPRWTAGSTPRCHGLGAPASLGPGEKLMIMIWDICTWFITLFFARWRTIATAVAIDFQSLLRDGRIAWICWDQDLDIARRFIALRPFRTRIESESFPFCPLGRFCCPQYITRHFDFNGMFPPCSQYGEPHKQTGKFPRFPKRC